MLWITQAFISYVRSIHLQKDKGVFKLDGLPLEAFAESLGLAGAPQIRFMSKDAASSKKNAVRAVQNAEAAVAGEASSSSDEEEETPTDVFGNKHGKGASDDEEQPKGNKVCISWNLLPSKVNMLTFWV